MGEIIFQSKGVPRKLKGFLIASIICFTLFNFMMLALFLLAVKYNGFTNETMGIGVFIVVLGILVSIFGSF